MIRPIPGSLPFEGHEVFYIEVRGDERFHTLIDAALDSCPHISPPVSGGAMEEKAFLHLPCGRTLMALSYKGDLHAWRNKLICYCKSNGRMWGTPGKQGTLVLSDASEIALNAHNVAFET